MSGPDPLADTTPITDVRSARVAAARRLSRRALRARDRRFLAEGPQAVREALARRDTVLEVFVTPAAAERHHDLVQTAYTAGGPVHLVSQEVYDAFAQTVRPQGISAVCRLLDVPLAEVTATAPSLIAVLAHVRDPGNAGTILRCADAAGADAVILTDASVDIYNAKCVRASAGSLFHLPVVVGLPVSACADALHAAGVRLLSADVAGTTDLDSAADTGALAVPTAWVFGNEAWGLPEDTLAVTDQVVRVPIHGAAESLNLATAAAICLYASARAQRQTDGCRSAASPEVP